MSEYRKCTVRDELFVEPCEALTGVMDGHSFGRGRALFLNEWMDLSTRTPTRSFVVLRMGQHLKKGIALNVCPFCGERIDAPFNKDDDT